VGRFEIKKEGIPSRGYITPRAPRAEVWMGKEDANSWNIRFCFPALYWCEALILVAETQTSRM